MARRTVTDHWFVSVEVSKLPRGTRLARQTKTFPTEGEAKQYAKEFLSHDRKIIAGTLLNGYQPVRRIIPASDLNRWIEKSNLRKRIHCVAHCRMLAVLHLDPVLLPASLIGAVTAPRTGLLVERGARGLDVVHALGPILLDHLGGGIAERLAQSDEHRRWMFLLEFRRDHSDALQAIGLVVRHRSSRRTTAMPDHACARSPRLYVSPKNAMAPLRLLKSSRKNLSRRVGPIGKHTEQLDFR
jgi:hypothetical protein